MTKHHQGGGNRLSFQIGTIVLNVFTDEYGCDGGYKDIQRPGDHSRALKLLVLEQSAANTRFRLPIRIAMPAEAYLKRRMEF
jgi:hypothetical protein